MVYINKTYLINNFSKGLGKVINEQTSTSKHTKEEVISFERERVAF